MEFKLPQISGEDVARMIRTSRNPNSNTPIVAVTGYLKDLSDPHHFDELMEKPATKAKLVDVLERQCFWKPPPADRVELGERKVSTNVNKQAVADTPAPPPFMGNPRDFVRGLKPDDDDTSSVISSVDGSLSRTNSSDWTGRPALPNTGSSSSVKSEVSANTVVRNTPATLTQHESAPPRLQPPAAERIPSPLSMHVTAEHHEDARPHLSTPPEMAPLPPSVTSTPVFARAANDVPVHKFASLSALGSLGSGPRRTPPQIPADVKDSETLKKSPCEDKPKSTFSFFPSSKDKNKEHSSTPSPTTRPISPPGEAKSKAKRTSLEKKKEKQWKQGLLSEEADADDEDSLCGGKKPSKSRSIREIIQGVKRSPEVKKDFLDTID